ncbi:aspartyl/glutamyl-tRNA(Asn/Gln) amidotransferase subunit B [Methanothermus fervidus DSM 2088]|uniref:Aspartyl/glutamyl-tRNA(Asn/Gln) amidotransferase subunit B n=1 Tax=Methanothermus fervidus (strain ATCC 43054 / DSM 2088 / JCM 10308 / V24 S) TaxID=523846 RepID=E3GWU2_METFV|nr:Asp-tRNA(Asn)/Glu-tRNA(Gln) amidotransferase subunit GatB [Methanothermus fervidus]ADP78011.1 aspartyl/glutamyl-tRNA(Asn/Gln) amidotransferase subunit B [Methanothermus fervidus DSM 2088]
MKCGFEIHIQLKTKSKLFCSCPTNYQDADPNTNVCPVCLNQPGAKPSAPNEKAIESALKIALMLGCKINKGTIYFMRKHYDYPDLPSGYQRTSTPIGYDGELNGIRIREVHLEEDPGQYKPDLGVVDFNRSGIPLIEVVTEPDINSPEEAREFLKELMRVLEYSEDARGEGTMRADVNVSLEGGRRVEIKNINSIKGAYKALKFEIMRQKNLLERGMEVARETRAFLESQMITVPMRMKEEAEDYRYIPDPDLPPMKFDEKYIEKIKQSLPETPSMKVKRFVEQYKISKEDAHVLTSELALANAFEEVAKEINPKFAAQWMREELKRVLSYNNITFAESGITPKQLIELLKMIQNKEITVKAGKKIIEHLPFNKKSPKEIAKELGLLGVIEDEEKILKAVEKAIKDNPKAVNDYHNGKKAALNFLLGQVMKLTKGKVDPQRTMQILKSKVEESK